MSITVSCPVCKEGVVRVTVNPGEPMVPYYPDGSGYPGSGPELDETECECECLASGLVDEGKYWDKVLELALEQGPEEPDYPESDSIYD